ncbi:SDR family oxidoreductase [Hymenobacter convexus]|uniref:SDR family oxidoreductase n=1 Tax=Hymenobacter sp. CA1UV-4 TaxID=3063782 RepID=UPI002712B07C|nr:SDR family oxidoreductase [Hymenobacter sp. CA1UV-4]MDO7851608.1 SDR family oxidoreductase [Hymenobacter sp. CA1UV-4]
MDLLNQTLPEAAALANPDTASLNEAFSLRGKVVVVTGGTGILGQAFIDGIVAAGGTVGILGRNADEAHRRADAITARGGQALALVADVLDEAQLRVACQQVLDTFGHIDGLVNAAGGNGADGVLDPAEDVFQMNLAGMKRVMELNLWGAIVPTQVFGEALAQAPGKASIVNISSMNSKRAITKVLGYNMGKAALDCYNQWFAVEMANRYGDRIRMNALAPGFFLTEQNRALLTTPEGGFTPRGELVIRQTPFKRFGHPDELKGALVWLLSDASQFVTGSMICVDGGFSIFGGV